MVVTPLLSHLCLRLLHGTWRSSVALRGPQRAEAHQLPAVVSTCTFLFFHVLAIGCYFCAVSATLALHTVAACHMARSSMAFRGSQTA